MYVIYNVCDLQCVQFTMCAIYKALEALNKKDLTEIRSFARPPVLVERVLEAVMILRKAEPTWNEAKRQLSKLADAHVCPCHLTVM